MNSLLKSFRKLQKGQGGLTLIEILIVVLILGIIAAVVILNVGGFLGTGEKEALCTEGDTVQAAVMAWCVNSSSTNCTGLNTTDLVTANYLLRATKYDWTINSDCTVNGTSTPSEYKYPDDCGG